MIHDKRFFVFCFCVILILATTTTPLKHLKGQAEPQYWIYTLEETEEAYHLLKIHVPDGPSEQLLSFPKTAESDLFSLMTEADIEAARVYFDERAGIFYNNDVSEVLSRQPLVRVAGINPSPDNRRVAVTVRYYVLAGSYGISVPNWFGTSQVLIVDGDTGDYHMVWNLGFMSCEFLPESKCPGTDVAIRSLTWTPDQRTLIASLSTYARSEVPLNYPLVVVPVEQDIPPFLIGWANALGIAPNSHELTTITYQDGFWLNAITFDLLTGQHSQTSYTLSPYFVDTEGGLTYIHEYPIFRIINPSEFDAGTAMFNMALFDVSRSDPLSLFRLDISAPWHIIA